MNHERVYGAFTEFEEGKWYHTYAHRERRMIVGLMGPRTRIEGVLNHLAAELKRDRLRGQD